VTNLALTGWGCYNRVIEFLAFGLEFFLIGNLCGFDSMNPLS
jgi:hypothetical protein